MTFDRRTRRLGAAVLGLTALGVATATLSANPAAASIIAAVSTISCSVAGTSLPYWCISGTNTSSGTGVVGSSKSGTGIVASTTSGNYALYAKAGSNGVGVYGEGAEGVVGSSRSMDGVDGGSYFGTGTAGVSTAGDGIDGISSTGTGVYAYSRTGTGIAASSTSSYGGLFDSTSNYGVFARSQTNVAFVGRTTNGNASDIQGSHIGLLGRAPTTGFPLVLTDATPNTLFYVDGYGNVYYSGSLYKFASTVGGGTARSFHPNSTQPTIEDSGTAQLVNGVAVVQLDRTFAASIDPTTAYRVFLTPAGDTRGLFVANRSVAGFVVRESQAGRSTVAFDYRILATALGKTGQRMAPINPATDMSIAKAPLPVMPAAPVARRFKTPALPSATP